MGHGRRAIIWAVGAGCLAGAVCDDALGYAQPASSFARTVVLQPASGEVLIRLPSVRGTNWGVRDRCDGTLTVVRAGVVAVTDFLRHKTVIVRAGQRYLAGARQA